MAAQINWHRFGTKLRTVFQKGRHQTRGGNSVNSQPIFKIFFTVVFSLVGVKSDDFFQLSTAVRSRGQQFKLVKEMSDVNVRKSFLASASLMYGTVCHQRLLILVHSSPFI